MSKNAWRIDRSGEPEPVWPTLVRRLALVPVATAYVLGSSFLGYTLNILFARNPVLRSYEALASLWFFDGWIVAPWGFAVFTLGTLAVGAIAVGLTVATDPVASVWSTGVLTYGVYVVRYVVAHDAPTLAPFGGPGTLMWISWSRSPRSRSWGSQASCSRAWHRLARPQATTGIGSPRCSPSQSAARRRDLSSPRTGTLKLSLPETQNR